MMGNQFQWENSYVIYNFKMKCVERKVEGSRLFIVSLTSFLGFCLQYATEGDWEKKKKQDK